MRCFSSFKVTTALLYILLLLSGVYGHVRWEIPAPRPSTEVKAFPCGDNSEWGVGPVTRMAVGMNEVVFDEFLCHAGDMVRIALSMHNDGQYDNHVLLDRLPHNDLCGTTANNLMAVNITLPNVDCINNECSLQIIQVMASKFIGQTCDNPSGIAQLCGGAGRMYYSCARVEIAGTASSLPTVFNDYYGSDSPVDYEWPLVAEWCQSSITEPWRTCLPTRQAEFDSTATDDDSGLGSFFAVIQQIIPLLIAILNSFGVGN